MRAWREDAEKQMKKALALDPLNSMYGEDLRYDLYLNHRYDEAVQQLRKKTELDPEDQIGHVFLALALEAKGQRAESLAENDLARQHDDASLVAGTVAGIYCRAGKPAEARKLLADIQNRVTQKYVAALQQAMIRFALGDKEEGFRWLNLSADDHDVNLQLLSADPVFDSVRQDARFVAVMKKIGLPDPAWTRAPFRRQFGNSKPD
jgi:adenylate cyclase